LLQAVPHKTAFLQTDTIPETFKHTQFSCVAIMVIEVRVFEQQYLDEITRPKGGFYKRADEVSRGIFEVFLHILV
jgi:hypothetical protein